MAAILVNSAEPMTRIKIVTVKDDSEKTLKVLQRIGAVHIEQSSELHPVDRTAIEQEHRHINELAVYINKILSYLPQQQSVSLDEDIEVLFMKPFSEISDEVKRIYNRTSRLQQKIEVIINDRISLKDTIKYLEPLKQVDNLTLNDLNYSGKILFSTVIVSSSDSSDELRNSLNEYLSENITATVENDIVIHAVAESRNQEKIETTVANFGGRFLDIPHENISLKEYLSSGSGKLAVLEEEKMKLTDELNKLIGEDLKKLILLREALNAANDRLTVLEKASEAKYVSMIEGWIPERVVDTATTEIKENVPYTYIETRNPGKEEEPPTKYKNSKGFKPFQIIVNLFAVPKYRDWDPTPIVSYSFALFFGLMICDVLYSLGLIILVKYLLKKFVDDPESESFKQFQRLLYTCLGVGLIFGVLTGGYFGDIYKFFGIKSMALVPALAEALSNPLTFIIIALSIGFIHVNIAHILAIIIAIKKRDKGTIVGRLGLFLVQVGLPTIAHSMLGLNIPGFTETIYSILMYVLYGGVVLCFVSSIMINKGLGAILWLFDITGFLGDVMSYARLAGVGLSTYYLAFTFNLMAGMFTDQMGGVIGTIFGFILAIVVLAFGHIINMVLTCITGFMHSMRLCFVEFLFKFYEGGGTEFSPFKLIKRKNVSTTIKS